MQPEAYRGHCTPMKTSPQSLPSPHPSSPKLLLSCFIIAMCVYLMSTVPFLLPSNWQLQVISHCSCMFLCSFGAGPKGMENGGVSDKTPFLAGPGSWQGSIFWLDQEIRWHHGQSSRWATIPSPSVASNPVELLEALSDHWLWGHRLLGWLCLLTGRGCTGLRAETKPPRKEGPLLTHLLGHECLVTNSRQREQLRRPAA